MRIRLVRTIVIILTVGTSTNYAYSVNDSIKKDSGNLRFEYGVQSRAFFMATYNHESLKDDYALGTAISSDLRAVIRKKLILGVRGTYMYNILSSDIWKPDPTTQQINRYETGLFDISDKDNLYKLRRIDELYISYSFKIGTVKAGRFLMNTPFINPQDGRLSPTFAEGIWIESAKKETFGIKGAWISGVAPRSTVKWYRLASSVGTYPQGVTSAGKKSDYYNNIEGSSGMGLLNVWKQMPKAIKVSVWNAFWENVWNTSILEISAEQKKKSARFYQGLMFFHQTALHNGGNSDQKKTYIEKGSTSNALSAQFGYKTKKQNYTLAYTRITGDGRYLMPREWGRDAFYTFLQRERTEGLGDVHAFMGKSAFQINRNFQVIGAYAYVKLPDVNNYRLNKYGMPSYRQINLYLNYAFSGKLKNLEAKILVAYKLNAGETYGNSKYIYNKVDLLNFNAVIDYKL